MKRAHEKAMTGIGQRIKEARLKCGMTLRVLGAVEEGVGSHEHCSWRNQQRQVLGTNSPADKGRWR